MNQGKMVSKQECKSMGLGMHGGIQIYMRGRQHSLMIHFPWKRFVSV
jgi:hypothetical protein